MKTYRVVVCDSGGHAAVNQIVTLAQLHQVLDQYLPDLDRFGTAFVDIYAVTSPDSFGTFVATISGTKKETR